MTTREVTHHIDVAARADDVFDWLRDVTRWPTTFPPTIHAEVVQPGDREELIRLWATANGVPKSWTSRRLIDPVARTIEFRQERTAPPLAEMVGRWSVEALPDGGAHVTLYHGYRPLDDVPEQWDLIETAVERNSTQELAALKSAVEGAAAELEAVFTFVDDVEFEGSAALAFEFLDRGDLWGERLDHVPDVTMATFDDGFQQLSMTTRTPDGSEHVTTSFRVSMPERGELSYKQTTLPPLLSLHTGVWRVVQDGDVVRVSSEHSVSIDESKIQAVLGPDATIADARRLARENLGANSRLTLGHVGRFAGVESTVAP